MKKFHYITLGSNNFWYGIDDTLSDAKQTAEDALSENGIFGDEESGHRPFPPKEVYIYKVFSQPMKTIRNEDEEDE